MVQQSGDDPGTNYPQILNVFLRDVESLLDSSIILMPILANRANEEHEKFKKFVSEKKIKEIKKKHEGITYEMNMSLSDEFVRYHDNYHKAEKAYLLFTRSLIVSLVSQFDTFLTKCLSEMINLYPSVLNSQDRKLSYSQMFEFANLDMAKQYMLESEIDEWFKDGYKKLIDRLEEKHKLKIKDLIPDYRGFLEVFERRNIFTHNDGIVNDRYISFCESVETYESPVKGSRLIVSPQYFQHGLHLFQQAAIIIAHQMWRKFAKDDLEHADGHLSQLIVQYIEKNKKPYIAYQISEYSMSLGKYFSEYTRLIFVINKALCLKRLGEGKIANKGLDKEDWSSANYLLRMCVAILRDEFVDAAYLMEKLGANNEYIEKDHYNSLPIFDELKTTKVFRSAYKKIYKEEFSGNKKIRVSH